MSMKNTAEPRQDAAPGMRDDLLFFRSWIRQAPLRALARAMASHVDPSIPGPVVELGPGTGAVTRALVERGVDPARLTLVEADPAFCALLRRRWPTARVLQTDA
jgi:phosphatidylethanolamine/phosphatidyl-N-methylethanolamine N-methyltransferase